MVVGVANSIWSICAYALCTISSAFFFVYFCYAISNWSIFFVQSAFIFRPEWSDIVWVLFIFWVFFSIFSMISNGFFLKKQKLLFYRAMHFCQSMNKSAQNFLTWKIKHFVFQMKAPIRKWICVWNPFYGYSFFLCICVYDMAPVDMHRIGAYKHHHILSFIDEVSGQWTKFLCDRGRLTKGQHHQLEMFTKMCQWKSTIYTHAYIYIWQMKFQLSSKHRT